MTQTQIVKNAFEKLKTDTKSHKFLVGFDGFIDEIIHVVRKRINETAFERIESISEFSERIGKLAGLSGNMELVPEQIKFGGNGPIMANAIISQNNTLSYIGAIGKNDIHPLFKDFAARCTEVITITEPGHTDALEFFDGKIMLGKMHNLVEVSWAHIIEKVGIAHIKNILSDCSLIAFTNWTMLSQMNTIIQGISDTMCEIGHKPYAFFDLADPQKRTKEDILELLKLIEKIHCKTILSMNENESAIIADILDIQTVDNILERAIKIKSKLQLEAIVIHPINGAAIAHETENSWINGPYTPKPKLTTGAGDNFNGGFCNALVRGLNPSESIACGVSTSGYYVRNGKSPNTNELQNFMLAWANNDCKDI